MLKTISLKDQYITYYAKNKDDAVGLRMKLYERAAL